MANNKEHKVGVYARLSKEDSRAGESVSIENQKLLLTKHVKEMGWELVEIYCDDGWSGTNQNRPALQRLLKDVKDLGFLHYCKLFNHVLPQQYMEVVADNDTYDFYCRELIINLINMILM